MAYSTVADVQNAAGGERSLRELSDVDNTNAVNTSAVQSAIVEADATIDSYLHSRVSVPIAAPVPEVIRALSAAIAVFILKTRRRNMLTEIDIQLQDSRLVQLQSIATGKVTLGVYPEPTKSPLLRYESTARSDAKAVSRNSLKGFC